MRLHANSAMRTTFKSAVSIWRRSSSQRASGHCSGYPGNAHQDCILPGDLRGNGRSVRRRVGSTRDGGE